MSTSSSNKTVVVQIITDDCNIEDIKIVSNVTVTRPNLPENSEAEDSEWSQMNLPEQELQSFNADDSQCSSDDVSKLELYSSSQESPKCTSGFSTAQALLEKTMKSSGMNSSPLVNEQNKCNSDKTCQGHTEVTDELMVALDDTSSEKSVRSSSKRAHIQSSKKNSKTHAHKHIPTDTINVLNENVNENLKLLEDMPAVSVSGKKASVRIEVVPVSASISKIVCLFRDKSEFFHNIKQSKQLPKNSGNIHEVMQEDVPTLAQVDVEANDNVCTLLNYSDVSPPETAGQMYTAINNSSESTLEIAGLMCIAANNTNENTPEVIGQMCTKLNNPDENHSKVVDQMCIAVKSSNESLPKALISNSFKATSASQEGALNWNRIVPSFPLVSCSPELNLNSQKTKNYTNKNKTSLNDLGNKKAKSVLTEKFESVLKREPIVLLKRQVITQNNKTYKLSSEKGKKNLAEGVGVPSDSYSETMCNIDTLDEVPCDNSILTADSMVSVLTSPHSLQRTTSARENKKSGSNNSTFVIIPPAEYVSFNQNGDVEFSDVILKAIPKLLAKGCTEIYFLLNKIAKVPSNIQEKMYKVDPSTFPYKFIPVTTFASEVLAKKKLTPQASAKKSSRKQVSKRQEVHKQEAMLPEEPMNVELDTALPRENNDTIQDGMVPGRSKRERPRKRSGQDVIDGLSMTAADGGQDRDFRVAVMKEGMVPDRQKRGRPRKRRVQGVIDGLSMTAEDDSDSDSVTNTTPHRQWTCDDVSKWLTFHGQGKFIQAFIHVDGSSLHELVHCFIQDFKIIQKYLHDLGFCLFEMLKLFAILRDVSKQAEFSTSSSSHGSSEAEHIDITGLQIQVQRGAPSTSQSNTSSDRTAVSDNSPDADSDNLNSNTPLSQCTNEDICSWLTLHGLSSCIKHFSGVDGPSLIELVLCFKADTKTVYTSLNDMGFNMSDILKLCAILRNLSEQVKDLKKTSRASFGASK